MKIQPDYYYTMALIGFFGLFSWLMLWPTLLGQVGKMPVAFVLILTVTPLLLPMRGLLHRNLRSCTWAAYISLGYFVYGAAEVYINNEQRFYVATEVLFSLMLFFGATLYVRFVNKPV